MNRFIMLTITAGLCGMLFGCNATKKQGDTTAITNVAIANVRPAQSASTQPSNNNVTGTVSFMQTGGDVKMVADITGLSPGKHGFHIHEKGDLSDPSLKTAGGHFDTTGSHHGAPDAATHHTGDMGNLVADSTGHAHLMLTLHGISLDQLVGKSVIVHASEDDLKADPSGNSGGRVAGGVIEMK